MRRDTVRPFLVLGAVLAVSYPTAAAGYAAQSATPSRETAPQTLAQSADPLRRPVTLNAVNARLVDVLAQISAQADFGLIYGNDVVPADHRVTLRLRDAPAEIALREALADANVDFTATKPDQVVLTQSADRTPSSTQLGTIVGRVMGAAAEAAPSPVPNAQVVVEETRLGTLADRDGRFRITDVPAGRRSVTASSMGWQSSTREVDVPEDGTVTIDFQLELSPSRLDQIVVTVTGEQRVRELGHVVGRINADSVVREAPVSSITELLNARVPGMQVFTGQGTVGGDATVRIRGGTSMLLTQEPVVIVDGIRYTSDRKAVQGSSTIEPTSRLNDLNPNDVESIEVVKGPSAATLYGTDAVNGVLVITTKRGRSGPARWNAYIRSAVNEIPISSFPNGYRAWSSEVDNCRLSLLAQDACRQDSVTTFVNPLNDDELTIFASKPRWEYGVNVSGGNDGIRYFVSGDFEDAKGPVQMPAALVEALKEDRGVDVLPEEQLEPNAFTKINLRSNLSAQLGQYAELQVSGGYTHNATRSIRNSLGPYSHGAFQGTPEDPYGTSYSPGRVFSAMSTERVNRFTGSARLDFRPRSWLSAWGVFGIDLSNSTRHSLVRPDEGPAGTTRGAASDERRRDVLTTGDLGLRTTVPLGRASSRTAVGIQYVRKLYDGVFSGGTGLPPGGETVESAEFKSVDSGYSETVTLGGYLEQTLGLNERLFLTGALRVDGASSFGRDYDAVVYPKASASWLLSEEPFVPRVPGLQEFRVRYAFGASGRQPERYMAVPGFLWSSAMVDGSERTVINYYSLGNPDLRPERTREHEFGFDASFLDSRVRLEGTWYYRTTTDAIRSTSLQPGFGSLHGNIGRVRDRGFEGQIWLRPIDHRGLSWDLSLLHSSNSNRLIDLGDTPAFYDHRGGLVEGHPIGARFMVPLIGYDDANDDGIIEQSEVVMGDTSVYVGQSLPPQSQTLNSVVGLFNQSLRISTVFERRSGYTQFDVLAHAQCTSGYCRAAVDPATPLDVQAQVAALGLAPSPASGGSGARYTFMSDASFVRLREVSVVWDLPAVLRSPVHLSQAVLSLSARNVAMWSSFEGIDVESVVGAGRFFSGHGGNPNGIPQARSWVVRLDVGF